MMKLLKMLIYMFTLGIFMGGALFATNLFIRGDAKDNAQLVQLKEVKVEKPNYTLPYVAPEAVDVVDAVEVRIAETVKETTNEQVIVNKNKKDSKARVSNKSNRTVVAQTNSNTQENDYAYTIVLDEVIIHANTGKSSVAPRLLGAVTKSNSSNPMLLVAQGGVRLHTLRG